MVVEDDAGERLDIVGVLGIVARHLELRDAAARDLDALEAHRKAVHVLVDVRLIELAGGNVGELERLVCLLGHSVLVLFTHV